MIRENEIFTNRAKMREMINNFGIIDKILLFTHVADSDGMGCEVLGKLFKDLLLKYRPEVLHASQLLFDINASDSETRTNLIDGILEIRRISYRDPVGEIKDSLEKNSGKNCLILITDISSSPELFEFIDSIKEPVLYIDHHEISVESMKAYNNMENLFNKFILIESGTTGLNQINKSDRVTNLFDLLEDIDFRSLVVSSKLKYSKISATYIFWVLILYLFPEIIVNVDTVYTFDCIMKLISDADTYEWKNHAFEVEGKDVYGTSLFTTEIPDIFSLIFKYRGGDYLVDKLYKLAFYAFVDQKHIRPADIEVIVSENEIFAKCREKNYEYYKKSAQMFLSDEFGLSEVTCAVDSDFSMFSNWKFKSNEKLDTTIMLYPDSRTISIRVNDASSINAAEIMKELFNGGGHAKAAGGKLDEEKFCNWLKFYWDLKANRNDSMPAPVVDLEARGLI